ncbi:MAG: hypothetical protein ACTH8V_08940 [Brachybacterium tyrofermentans]
MQRLLAVLLILIGVIGLVLGRLGETTWAPPTETTATVELSSPGPAVVIDPGVLYVGGQKGEVTIEGSSDVSLITADNSDIEAYLADTSYTRITGASDWSTLSTEAVNPEGATELSDPTGSDLWRTVETKPSPYTVEIADFAAEEHGDNQQAYRAILVVTDGTEAGADSVSITWPVENENEWVPFAYAGGAAIAVIGLVLLVVSIGGRRREDDEDAELEATDAATETDRAAVDPEVEAGAAAGTPADADADADADAESDDMTTDGVTSDSEAPGDPVRLFHDDTEVLAPVDGKGDDVADPDAGRPSPTGPEDNAWGLGEDRGTPEDVDDRDSEDRR